jgi:hypothetical protein
MVSIDGEAQKDKEDMANKGKIFGFENKRIKLHNQR